MFGKKDIFFMGAFILLTTYLLWKANTGHRFADYLENREWKGLIAGIITICGASAVILPFCFSSRFFDKYVL